MTAVTKKNISSIQLLRGIAVILVLIFHMAAMEKKYGSTSNFLSFFSEFGASGVDLFFLISGFIMYTVTFNGSKSRTPLQFLSDRITRIYPLYWLFSLIIFTIFLVRPDLVNPSQKVQSNILYSFLLIPQQVNPLLMVGWTLIHELYFYLVFALILFNKKRITKGLAGWAFGILILHLVLMNSSVQLQSPTLRLITHPLTLEFIAGCFIARLILQKQFSVRLPVITSGICLLFSAYYCLKHQYGISIIDGWYRVIVFGLPWAMILYGAAAYEFTSEKRLDNSLTRIGDASYSIYLSHTLVIEAVSTIWTYFISLSLTSLTIIWLLLMFFSALLFGVFCHTCVEKPLIGKARKVVSYCADFIADSLFHKKNT